MGRSSLSHNYQPLDAGHRRVLREVSSSDEHRALSDAFNEPLDGDEGDHDLYWDADVGEYMIPLSSTQADDMDDHQAPKSVSLFTGLGLIIGMCIGSGIFASPGPVLAKTGSAPAALLVWLAGGLLCLLGASSYAELGAAMPGNGGEFLYLLKAFGTLPAFLFSWTNISVARPASVAVIASVFGEYATRLIRSSESAGSFFHDVVIPRTIGILLIWTLTAVNCFSRVGTSVQDIFTVLKLAAMVFIGVAGFATVSSAGSATAVKAFSLGSLSNSSRNPGDYATAMYSSLWAYDGWNNLNLVTGELARIDDLPRAVTIGPLVVTACYMLVNAAYYAVLPLDLVRTSNTVALDFGLRTIGEISRVIVPMTVMMSTFGSCNAAIFTGARLTATSAQHSHAPRFLGRLAGRTQTPINALFLQSILATIFCASASFTPLVTFYSDIAWMFYFATVVALLVLRRSEPWMARPFRVWLLAPLLFCVVTLGMIGLSCYESPVEAACAAAFTIAGIPVWWWTFGGGPQEELLIDDALVASLDDLIRSSMTSQHHLLGEELTALATVAALTSANRSAEVGPAALSFLLRSLVSDDARREALRRIREAIFLVNAIVGAPRTINSLTSLRDSVRASALAFLWDDSFVKDDRLVRNPDAGRAHAAKVYGPVTNKLVESCTNLHPFLMSIIDNTYGSLFASEAVLTHRETELCLVAGLSGQGGMVDRQLESHRRGAVRCGATEDEVNEVIAIACRVWASSAAVQHCRI